MSRSAYDRRAALRLAGAAAMGIAGAGCAGRHAGSNWLMRPRRRFARVLVAPDRVIRTVVGLRPYRPSGFVVRAERFDDKTIVHHYGHGGGGITLSWGTAHLAAEEVLQTEEGACAVVGCGAVGLATARLLQRLGRSVTIYARDLPPHTTSNIAGGQWSPFSVFDENARSPAFDEQFERAARFAYTECQDLVGAGFGVRWIENYFLDLTPEALPPFITRLRDLYPELTAIPRGAHPWGARNVTRFTTMLVEPAVYLPAMLREFFIAGGRVEVRDFADVASVLALPERTIANCTGLGARDLFGDQELIPVKGQLTVLLPQPEVDYILLGGNALYMFPRSDGIVLGGTFERGEWSLEPNPDAARRIMDGHRRLFGNENG